MKYYCNPLNVVYRYQFNKPYGQEDGTLSIDREAANPSMICFKVKILYFPVHESGMLDE